MGFFDEDNRKFERTALAAIVLVTIYVGSFCAIRVSTSSDDCSLVRVDFPTGAVREVYRPLINLDKKINDAVVYESEVDEVRFAARYYCGE